MNMNDSMNIAKGMGAGLVVGAAIGMLVCGGRKKSCPKHPVGRALRTIGEIVENLGGAMGF